MEIPSAVIGLILSIVLCFFGYRLKRIAFAIVWFVIGYNLGGHLLPIVSPYMQGIDPFFINLIPLLIGILCSLIGVSIERVCIFLLGIGIAVLTYFNMVSLGSVELSWLGFGLALVIGSILGTVAVSLMRPAIILFTSYSGACQLAVSAAVVIPELATGWPYLITLAIITIAGAAFQFKSTKHLK